MSDKKIADPFFAVGKPKKNAVTRAVTAKDLVKAREPEAGTGGPRCPMDRARFEKPGGRLR